MLAKLLELKSKNEALKNDMKLYEKCDPARIESIAKDTKVAKDACDRWVDNIF